MPFWVNRFPDRVLNRYVNPIFTEPPMSLSTTAGSRPEVPTPPAPRADLPCQTCDTSQEAVAKANSCRDFRNTLGRFATGVTVVTALAADGEPIGVTISSFNSVSLDPPLILWSLSLHSPKLEAFRNASHYAINVLASGQQALSDRFAARRGDRFADLPRHVGEAGVPLLDACCAWFECSHEAHYAGGDHLIFVGRVEHFAQGEAAPLIFHNGCYARLAATDGD